MGELNIRLVREEIESRLVMGEYCFPKGYTRIKEV